MIVFLFGQDTYRSYQELKKIFEHYKKNQKKEVDLKILDLKEKNFEDFKTEISFSSVFAEKKLIVLKNVFSNRAFQEKFLREIECFSKAKETILFYEEGDIKEKSFFQAVKKHGKWQEFQPLEDWSLKVWIKRELKKLGAEIEEEALRKLIEFVGNDLWQISNEMKKLVNYTNGKIIKKEEIELLVRPKIERDIFRALEAIAGKDKKTALKLIKNHLARGEKVSYLLAMIKYQFKNLLIIKDLLERKTSFQIILKKLQIPRFVFQKNLALAKKFTLSQLKNIYRKIFKGDLAIKTGKIDPETVLDLLITEI